MSDTVASLGRVLSNETVERIARAAFPELEGASSREVMRRACDVRDVLDGLPVATVSRAERARAEAAARASGATR